MLRVILLATVVVVGGAAAPAPVKAAEGPWCALLNFGADISEDCQYRTVEECLQTIIAGFRGFCNPNPRWQPEAAERRRPRKG